MRSRAAAPALLIAAGATALLLPALATGRVWDGGVEDLRNYAAYRSYAAYRLSLGDLPLWNPHFFCGVPFAANPTSGLFYAPNLLFGLLPFGPAWTLFAAVHLVVAALGMFAFLRRLGASPWASAGAGAAWLLSGWLLEKGWMGWMDMLASAAWAPWVLWAFEAAGARGVLAAGTLIALQVLAGRPEIPFFTGCALVLLGVARADGARGAAAVLGRSAAAAAVAGALAAVVLLPALHLERGSTRTALEAHPPSAGAVTWETLPHLLVPGPTFPLRWPRLFAGLGGLVLGAVAWRRPDRRRLLLGLAVTAAAGLLLAFGSRSRLLGGAAALVPGVGSLRDPTRWLFLWHLASAAAVGLGLDRLAREADAGRVVGRWVLAAGLCLVAAMAGAATTHRGSGLLLAYFSGRPLRPAAPTALLPYLPHVLPLSLWGIALLSRRRAVLLALALLVETAGTSWRLLEFRPPFPAPTAAATEPALAGVRRTVVLDPEVRPYETLLARLPTVKGTGPALPRGYADLWRAADPRLSYLGVQFALRNFPLPLAAIETPEGLLDLLGVDAVIDTGGVRRRPGPGPVPFVARQVVSVRDPEGMREALARILRSPDPRGLAIVEGARPPVPDEAVGTAEEIRSGPERRVVRVRTAAGGLLVFPESFDAGWRATVDGRVAPALAAYGGLLGVAVPPGDRLVVWTYRPRGFLLGLGISAASALALCAVAACGIGADFRRARVCGRLDGG